MSDPNRMSPEERAVYDTTVSLGSWPVVLNIEEVLTLGITLLVARQREQGQDDQRNPGSDCR
jgi:hypothetical protein